MQRVWLLLLAGCGGVSLEETPSTAGIQLSEGPARGVDLEVAPDGTFWVSWVEGDALRLTWSLDGVRFEPPITVPLDHSPTASLARRPRLAVSEERVALTLSDGLTVDARVLLLVANRVDRVDGADLVFEAQVLDAIGLDGSALDTLDQPTVAFAPDGALVASWKIAIDHDYGVVVARESSDWEPVYASGFVGQPCECCPHELMFDGGDLLLVQRSNQLNLREIYVGREQADGFVVSRVSDNGWVLSGCPFDGPRIAVDESELLVTWMDATSGEARAWISTSADGGASWSEAAQVFPEGPAQAFPNVVVSGGRRWITVEELFAETVLLESDGENANDLIWVERPLRTPGGTLVGVDAAGGPAAALAGLDAADALWFVRLD